MLAEPAVPVHAVGRTEWPASRTTLKGVPETFPGAQECQLWTYSPALEPQSTTVDPLSLFLSLRELPDERVQGALEDLMEQLPW